MEKYDKEAFSFLVTPPENAYEKTPEGGWSCQSKSTLCPVQEFWAGLFCKLSKHIVDSMTTTWHEHPHQPQVHESVDGSTRRALVQEREELRGAVLKEALPQVDNFTLRPVRAWANRDKLSSAWLLSMPGPEGMSSQAFAEAMSIILCMPSPACKERVGA